jgi:hypothetical protein
MTQTKNHPLTTWLQRESGRAKGEIDTPENALAEDKLIVAAWNAAIEHALSFIYADGNPLVARDSIQELYYESQIDITSAPRIAVSDRVRIKFGRDRGQYGTIVSNSLTPATITVSN